MTTANTALA